MSHPPLEHWHYPEEDPASAYPDALEVALQRQGRQLRDGRAAFGWSAEVLAKMTNEARQCHQLAGKMNRQQRLAINGILRSGGGYGDSLITLLGEVSRW